MSRVIVKNLPKYLDDERFRSHFSTKGEITDAKLIFSKDGEFRRFGYIGFKSEVEALATVDYFNRSYIDTSKIQVELAKAIGDPSLPRAWSRYSKTSSAWALEHPDEISHKDLSKPENEKALDEKEERKQKLLDALFAAKNGTNEKLQNYLQTFGSRQTSKTWANDELNSATSLKTVPKVQAKENDDADYQDLPKPDQTEELVHLNEADKQVLEEQAGAAESEAIADTGRLFVRNVPFSTTEEDLRRLFAAFGPIAEIILPVDRITKHTRGFAFVMYVMPEHALTAYVALNQSIFQGRILDIIPGKEKDGAGKDSESMTFKEKKSLKEKNSGEFTWNSLFMNSDAVTEAMARKLGVSKLDLLNPEAENMAVRVALAETQVIQEAKAYLESENVCLSSFEQSSNRMQRSDSIILAKNIPYSVELQELAELFGAYGDLGRVVMPPTKTIALVEFLDSGDAKRAFRKLYMRKLHHLPLKLEWAPMKTFTEVAVTKQTTVKDVDSSLGAKLRDDEDSETLQLPSVSVFVKNISFESTREALQKAFSRCVGYRDSRIITKTKKDGTLLSTGFGFVEFADLATAKRAIQSMQGFELDQHKLELKLSTATKVSNTEISGSHLGRNTAAEEGDGTKIAIRNIPFEANEKEIRALFHPFGQIKSVRLPKKASRELRGFGFVSFYTKSEAKAAFEALQSTHLYGRHLVLEWAKDDSSVQALRKRTTDLLKTVEMSSRRQNKKLKLPEASGAGDDSLDDEE